jgi:hypothetical protein
MSHPMVPQYGPFNAYFYAFSLRRSATSAKMNEYLRKMNRLFARMSSLDWYLS